MESGSVSLKVQELHAATAVVITAHAWIVGLSTGVVKIRDFLRADGACRKELTGGHRGAVRCLAADDQLLVSGGQDGRLLLWSMAGSARKPLHTLSSPRLWSLRGGDVTRVLRAHTGAVTRLAVCAGRLLSASADRTCRDSIESA
ncbi:PREDICTED: uncharacterized protein LOC106809903 [Priapulus caudatus]|uniref:Uncharacterized protein LOC106809903 n=1 Tax=Priapulus caudatus TaxID=37621 RepID=A0ABM1E8V6_PRICU|nr:PREDICTED: uncharacterized protein LOC106809903 [Priapulus caudatus]